jgi:hypothetical protein
MVERPTAPTVEIELDKKRHLKIDFNAFALAEKETGKNFFSGIDWTSLSANEARALLWAALVWEDPSLTPEAVGSMLFGDNLSSIIEKITEAFEKSFPKQAGGPKAKKS